MRIDAHQHFWRYHPAEYGWIDDSMQKLQRDFLPADLHPELKSAGFDGCIAVQACHTLEETRWLLELASSCPFIFGVIGWVDLQSPHVHAQLTDLGRNPKLLGIRHIAQAEPDDRFLLRPDFLRGVALLEEFNLTYDILIYPKHLPVAIEFASRFPRQRFVLDHLAKPFIKRGELDPWRSEFRRLAALPNVYCKLSGMVTEADWQDWKPDHLRPYLEAAFECFGHDRLMIGSDWPVCTVAASYSQTMNLVAEFFVDYPRHFRDAIFGGNATRFWRLRVS